MTDPRDRKSKALTTRDALAKAGGLKLIAAERRRQIEAEGWTPEHDAEHGSSRLLRAAEAYEWGAVTLWPWGGEWWKPKDALSDLIRAGALYQAAADVSPALEGAAQAGVERCAVKIDALLAAAHQTLLASGAVIDAATLADELVGIAADAVRSAYADDLETASASLTRIAWTVRKKADALRALAAALTERAS